MEEKLNDLLVRIKNIALEEEIYDIVNLINEVNDLLGDNYEIYKLANELYIDKISF